MLGLVNTGPRLFLWPQTRVTWEPVQQVTCEIPLATPDSLRRTIRAVTNFFVFVRKKYKREGFFLCKNRRLR